MIKARIFPLIRRARPLAVSAGLHGGAVALLLAFAALDAPISATPSAAATVLLGPGDVVASAPGTATFTFETVDASSEMPDSELPITLERVVAEAPIQPNGELDIAALDEPIDSEELQTDLLMATLSISESAAGSPATATPLRSDALSAMHGGGGCNVADYLRASLQADQRILDGLARLPRQARSVANAVMVWDGAWVEVSVTAAPISQMLRASIEDILRAAPVSCQELQVTGPTFIILEDPRGATVLVLGSGAWRWGDLI
ncbi:MAG: hypothetical protein H7124_09065 [Phycisphaerales bacterium]|nr:hypothetical protein [Hyphomonadaceae bacterium]